jgi:hypothetical protein
MREIKQITKLIPLKIQHIHKLVNKFWQFSVSIQRSDIPSIFLYYIIEIVVLIIHGKFHPYNPLFRYLFEVNKGYQNDNNRIGIVFEPSKIWKNVQLMFQFDVTLLVSIRSRFDIVTTVQDHG